MQARRVPRQETLCSLFERASTGPFGRSKVWNESCRVCRHVPRTPRDALPVHLQTFKTIDHEAMQLFTANI
jgi:hypothetical protein